MKFEIINRTVMEARDDGTLVVVETSNNVNILDVVLPTTATETHTVNASEKRYGILTFSRKNPIAKILPLNHDIVVRYLDVEYSGHSHSSCPGRIDRLSKLIHSNFDEGTKILATFDANTNTLLIEEK